MKKIIIFGILSAMCLLSCKGTKGDVGPAGSNGTNGINGTNGTNGTNGNDGNANVIQVEYGPKINTYLTSYPLPRTIDSKPYFINGSVNVYVKTSGNLWYFLPGIVAESGNEYSVRLDGTSEITVIRKVDNTKTSETFQAARVVLIPASKIITARKSNLDFTNYEEVVKALNPVTINQ